MVFYVLFCFLPLDTWDFPVGELALPYEEFEAWGRGVLLRTRDIGW